VRIGPITIKRRVWVGLGFAVAVTVTWWGWTRGKPPGSLAGKPPVPPPFVRLAGVGPGAGDQVLRERAELFDPTPLFFPTEWNYGQQALPPGLQPQPGQVFGSFDPKLVFTAQKMKTYGAESTPAPEKLSDVLVQGNEAPFAGIGQEDTPRSALPERNGFLEVREFGSDKPVVAQILSGLSLARVDFQPLEFMVVISSAGVVGDMVLMTGSGWEEVDAFFRAYLVKTYRLGERLYPGRYRILIGP
jgi:hypothetical protein